MMKKIIEQLFLEFGFESRERHGDLIEYYRNHDDFHEYYFVHFVDSADLSNYLSEKYQIFLLEFGKAKLEAEDVSKNSSLIVCANYHDGLPVLLADRKRVIEVEEDQYTARKYVLSYCDFGIERIRSKPSISEYLKTIVKDVERFDQFSIKAVADIEYYIVMQLFAKLPFLLLKDREDGGAQLPMVASLETMVTEKVGGEKKFTEVLNLLLKVGDLGIFSGNDTNKEIEAKFEILVSDQSESDILKKLLEI